jgi:Flp pilus assembly protein TadG
MIFHARKQRSARRRGAVLVLVAIALSAILGLAALSLDAGNMFRERRNTQTAADAAAEAASIELFNNFETYAGVDSDGAARAAALAMANTHVYSSANVVINIPPLSGAYVGKAGYVEVLVKTQAAKGFSAIFGGANKLVSSRSVAAGASVDTLASMLVLDPLKKNAFKLRAKVLF